MCKLGTGIYDMIILITAKCLTLSLTTFSCLLSHCLMSYETSLKSRPSRKWRRFECLCVRPFARTIPTKQFKTKPCRQHSMFFAVTLPVGLWFYFCKDRQNPDSNYISFLSKFASKGFKSGYNYFWACASVWETSVLVRPLESRKKFLPFGIISS